MTSGSVALSFGLIPFAASVSDAARLSPPHDLCIVRSPLEVWALGLGLGVGRLCVRLLLAFVVREQWLDLPSTVDIHNVIRVSCVAPCCFHVCHL
jgi:hypothetical protein